MAKKSHRRGARKSHTRRRNQKRRGGYQLQGADLNESLYGSNASKMSLAQGQDYGNYHQAQHGGVADYGRAFDVMTDSNMLASSMSSGPLQAIADVRGLSDAQPKQLDPTVASPGQTNGGPSGSCGTMLGGRRRRRRRNQRSQKKSKKSQRSQRSQKKRSQRSQKKRQGGGGLGYAPVTAPGLLLGSNREYTQAGLNPEYYQSSSTEQFLADMRDAQ